MKGKKDDRGSPKLAPLVYQEISIFAISRGKGIAEVLVDAWKEYKEAHDINVPMPSYVEAPAKKRGSGKSEAKIA